MHVGGVIVNAIARWLVWRVGASPTAMSGA